MSGLATQWKHRFSNLNLLFALFFGTLLLTGCGQTVVAATASNSNVVITASQMSVRVGGSVNLPTSLQGIRLSGGSWAVTGGAAFGSVDQSGVYHAPSVVPSASTAILTYSVNKTVVATTVSLLNPLPSLTSIFPALLTAKSTPVVVTGTGFVSRSVISVNGIPISTTYVDAQHLAGTVVLASPLTGTTQIAVSNPDPGAALSSGLGVKIALPLAQPLLPITTLNTPSYFMEQSDEFVGPFQSWVNVKSAFGAVGDGITDDTVAIQRAISSMTSDSPSSVLWFPAGDYKITSPLLTGHMQFFSIIGEDPRTTNIVWAGPQVDTVIELNGSSWQRLSRLTVDGSDLATFAVGMDRLTGDQNPLYSTFNELSDLHIKRVKVGLNLKIAAETTIERVFFDTLATAGLAVGDFNTLDIFINDSLFLNCGTGLTDAYNNGAGSFIVSNSYFVNSQVADMTIANTGMFTARHNTSVGSKAFFVAQEIYNNSANITLQNNTILDPKTTPFQFGNLGPFMLIDNVVRLKDSTIPIIEASWTPTGLVKDVFSMGNVYTPNGGVGTGNLPFQGRIVSYDDSIVPVSAIPDVTIPSNVYVPPNLHRSVFEVGARTGAAVQAAINQAVASKTPKPVVHLQKGAYAVSSTITFPTGSDVQLVGDDAWMSELAWTGTTNAAVLAIPTSNVSLRAFHVQGGGAGTNDGVLLKVADEPNTQVIVDQANVQSKNSYSINFDGLEHATAEMFSTYVTGSVTGVRVTGGAFRAAKEGTVGITNHYTGAIQSLGNGTSFDVSAGGKYMVQDTWHDYGLTSPQNFKLSGSGTVTQQGGTVFMNSSTPLEIDNFSGNVSLIGFQFTGGFRLASNAGQANLLNLGLIGDSATYLPTSTGNITVGNVLNSYSGGHIAEGTDPNATWMRSMLAQSRTEYPIARPVLASGANRIRINRVMVDSTSSAIHMMPDAPKTGLYYVLTAGLFNLANTNGTCVSTTSSNANDQWLIMAAGDGDFEIVSKKTGTALGFATSADQALTLEPITGLYDQRWLINKLGDGSVSLTNRQAGTLLSLPVPGGCAGLGTGGSTSWMMTAY